MENLKAIKDRIKTVTSIIKATNAMKMVSTVKLAKLNNSSKKCSKESAEILFDMFSKAAFEIVFKQEYDEEPWFYRKDGKTLIIILSMDQGFCGSFNQSIIDKSSEIVKSHPNAYIETFGKKIEGIIKKNKAESCAKQAVSSRYDVGAFSNTLASLAFDYIANHEVNRVMVVSGEFKNVLVQKAKCTDVFSIDKFDFDNVEYTAVEGSRLEFIDDVFQAYLKKSFDAIITEHLVSELSARVMAMDNSVKSANDMSEKLNALYNRVRQAKITQELTEIVSSIEGVK